MQGACVFRYDYPVLIMYKEIEKNRVLFVIYTNYTLKYNYITCKQLTNLIPVDAVHILTKLPYYNELHLTLRFWKIMVLNKLKHYSIL
jgi:hypothetical protein